MWTKRIATLVATAAVAGAFAAPAAAQNQQEGLVNVAVEDVTIQVPVAVAANLCDINVAVLAEIVDQGGSCTATADSAATAGPNSNGKTRQEGLVNVLVDDVVVQVPVAVAANVCDVNVAILATVLDDASACEATADAAASQGPGRGGAAAARSFEPIDLSTVAGAVRLDNDPTTSTGIPL
ncbi:hypothetical protein BH20ACT15_BH20ACT15_16270 [soil metagenome]